MQEQQKIQVKASDDDLKGRFTNAANIHHQKEQFFLDFFVVAPPAGQLVSRLVTTPEHMKAIANAINDQLRQYEKNFGKVEVATSRKPIGFTG